MPYLIHLAILFSIYAILGISLNLVVGYAGMLSVTHAAFYGIGAYASAILLTRTNIGFVPALFLAIIFTMMASFIASLVLSKFKSDYYALVSFGLNIIIFSILMNWQSFTKGPLGISGIPKPNFFGFVIFSNSRFLFLSLLCLIFVYAAARFIAVSSFGRVLKAIREDEKAIQIFGYNTALFKTIIFILSAGMAAIAGSLFASYISFIEPSTFSLMESIFILAIIILGGLANIKGSIIGALFLVLLPEVLRFVGFPMSIAAQMRHFVYGLILVLLMLYRPQGLMGEYKL